MNNLQTYYENTQKPWGTLFYQILWKQLSFVKAQKVLDFGSGFGITANFLAAHNNVTAVEPDANMSGMGARENEYQLLTGGFEQLAEFPDCSFDFIACHNVLEYVEEKGLYIKEFSRILRKGGVLSLVKHNHAGRIMQRIIFENNLELAIKELEGHATFSRDFGEIKYYNEHDIRSWADDCDLKIDHIFGVRTFFGLVQNNDIKFDEIWQRNMLEAELKAGDMEDFKNIAFFHHILISKQ